MVDAVASRGYGGATVSRVVRLAGVSRATFYEHFDERDECFLAAYRSALERVRGTVGAASAASGPIWRLEAVIDALLAEVDERPAVARMILVEALGAPSGVRSEHERLIDRLDSEVAGFLDTQPVGAGTLQIPATALLGGVSEVLATRVSSGPEASSTQLREELVGWVETYRLPQDEHPLPQNRWAELGRFARIVAPGPDQEPALLPRGRSALPSTDAAQLRRRRILDATVRLVAEQGYAELTVARITEAARVPRSAFYSHFKDKEEALLAVQIEGMQGAVAAAAAEYSVRASWPERVWRSLVAFFTYVAEHPCHAQLDFVEAYAAGPEVTRHRQQNRMAFALFLEEGYHLAPRPAAAPSRFCSEAIGAAVYALMRKLVVEERVEQMLSLVPAAAYTVLAPFIGPQEAAARVQAWARTAPRAA
jgi:AcrR family transcriptional regulator